MDTNPTFPLCRYRMDTNPTFTICGYRMDTKHKFTICGYRVDTKPMACNDSLELVRNNHFEFTSVTSDTVVL